jgi:hypothetical protein
MKSKRTRRSIPASSWTKPLIRAFEDARLRKQDHDLEEELRYVDRLLRVDVDGTRFVDYLGASESEFDDPAGYFLFLRSHAELVRGKLAATTGRVREKFEWLAAYHNSVVENVVAEFEDGSRSAEAFMAEFDVDPEPFLRAMVISPTPEGGYPKRDTVPPGHLAHAEFADEVESGALRHPGGLRDHRRRDDGAG